MAADPPVDFQSLAQGATGQTNADYPYSIKATDLMRNFVFATLDVEDGLVEATTGVQGHRQRKLRIPSPPAEGAAVQLTAEGGSLSWSAATSGIPAQPSSGFVVLASIGGVVQWVETEACD
jgi:hypothetical protein